MIQSRFTKKAFFISLLVAFFIATCSFSYSSAYAESSVPRTPPPKDGLIIALLYPHIADAIVKQYGEGKLFQNEEVLAVKQDPSGGNTFIVTVFFQTFTGPHNPPYGNDTLTFTVSAIGVTLDKYEHIASQ